MNDLLGVLQLDQDRLLGITARYLSVGDEDARSLAVVRATVVGNSGQADLGSRAWALARNDQQVTSLVEVALFEDKAA
jgi:hypothetical protein